MRKLLLFNLSLLSLVGLQIYAATDSANPVESKSAGIIDEIKNNQQSLAANELFGRKIMSSLFEINQKMKTIAHDKSRLTEELLASRLGVERKARQIAELEDKLREQRLRLARFVKTSYQLSRQSLMQTLLTLSHLSDVDRAMRVLTQISERDLRIVQEYRTIVVELSEQRKIMARKVEKLMAVDARVKERESKLSQEQNNKVKLISRLRKEKKNQLSKIRKLRIKSDKIEKQDLSDDVLEILETSIYEKKGQIQPPVSGPVLQGFGFVEDTQYQIKLAHKGVYFSTPPETKVKSIFKGRVAFAGAVPGHGISIIVDHGDHYYSVYSNNAVPKVIEGQKVDSGQVLALSGQSTLHFGPGVYMELRHFSDAIDPLPWLKKTDKIGEGS